MGKRVSKSPACLRSPWQLPQIRQGRWDDFCQTTNACKRTDPQHCIVTLRTSKTCTAKRAHTSWAQRDSAKHDTNTYIVLIFSELSKLIVLSAFQRIQIAQLGLMRVKEWQTAVLTAPAYQRLLEKPLIKLCSCLAISVLTFSYTESVSIMNAFKYRCRLLKCMCACVELLLICYQFVFTNSNQPVCTSRSSHIAAPFVFAIHANYIRLGFHFPSQEDKI